MHLWFNYTLRKSSTIEIIDPENAPPIKENSPPGDEFIVELPPAQIFTN